MSRFVYDFEELVNNSMNYLDALEKMHIYIEKSQEPFALEELKRYYKHCEDVLDELWFPSEWVVRCNLFAPVLVVVSTLSRRPPPPFFWGSLNSAVGLLDDLKVALTPHLIISPEFPPRMPNAYSNAYSNTSPMKTLRTSKSSPRKNFSGIKTSPNTFFVITTTVLIRNYSKKVSHNCWHTPPVLV